MRADELFEKSVHCEDTGHLKKALHYRVRALDEYVAIVKGTSRTDVFSLIALHCVVDEDADRRQRLRLKVKQGLAAAEVLKKRMREANPQPVSPPANARPTTAASISNATDRRLTCELARVITIALHQ